MFLRLPQAQNIPIGGCQHEGSEDDGGSAAPGHLRSLPRAGRALHRSAAADSCLSHPLLRSLPGHPLPAGRCQPDSRDCSMAAASLPPRLAEASWLPAHGQRRSHSAFGSFSFSAHLGALRLCPGTTGSTPGVRQEEEEEEKEGPKSFSLTSPVTISCPCLPLTPLCPGKCHCTPGLCPGASCSFQRRRGMIRIFSFEIKQIIAQAFCKQIRVGRSVSSW